MQCDYFDAGACRSCAFMGEPHAAQLARKDAAARALLAEARPGVATAWEAPFAPPESGFRNKAKMVAGGTVEAPTLGILDAEGHGVDLRGCGLHEPAIVTALPLLASFVTTAGLTPYDVPSRRGELKHVLVTCSPDGELMVRWVLRSTEPLPRLRKHLPALAAALEAAGTPLRVASANLQPEHKAVLEGPEEVLLTEASTLPMRLDGLTLHLRPQAFFQTSTPVARALYATAAAWVADARPASVVDLYCGVGGFALHLAAAGAPRVHGVEIAAEAVAAARRSAQEAGLSGVTFAADDATAWAAEGTPDLVVVNPPRRGLGPALCGSIEDAAPPLVLYSSCQATTLARDLGDLPSYDPVRAQVLDMFPQTAHHETLVLLRRRPGRP
ncbi:methyltransferase domain-containing protein [Nocardioides sp. GY 10127]|uniref:methyltransferase domain-containing protein n=1 Tax=Nocardioides sp. GY 10127 TaxID=2569762 RepID=UPI0010A8FA3D|nr:methyltransferase domain-containing protein [Nocardioides sp. GY 10127]TIC84411.1 methyltransferase domain-containing protein [Nocardioides sp. GY 10127]